MKLREDGISAVGREKCSLEYKNKLYTSYSCGSGKRRDSHPNGRAGLGPTLTLCLGDHGCLD